MKLKIIYAFLLASFGFQYSTSQQIITDDSLPLEQLIQNNLGQNCVEISNIVSTINGSINGFSSYGFFERGDSNFPFENGIVLTTGNVNSAGNVLNTSSLNEGDDNWLTDADLENALGITNTQNATSIQFNFISVANQIQFNYILASEEYEQNFPCSYSDGFAFLIREAGSTEPFTNIALIPGTEIPVNTNTIHDVIVGQCDAQNEAYFEGYNIGDTNYNGRTVVMTATAAIQPNLEYEIKLVIADQNDENYDSAVFIEGNSFNASVDLGPDITTCGESVMLNGDIANPQATYQWFQDDILLNGENGASLEVVTSGTYRVEVTIQLNQTSCVIEDAVDITLNSEQPAGTLSDFLLCDDESNNGVEEFDFSLKDTEVLYSVPPSSYNISYHLSSEEAQNNINPIEGVFENTSSPQQIFVRIEDTVNGCLAYSTFNLVVNQVPEFVEPDPIIVCQDATLEGITYVDLTQANSQIANGNTSLFISYHYSQPEADLGINPIYSPYINNNISETLYVRVYDSSTGCFSTTTIDIQFQSSPSINTETQWINACEQDFDGFENFDLTSVIDNVLLGLTGVTVSFHENLYDAQNNINPIANPEDYQNIVPNYQVIYIRVEDDTTGCFAVTQLELHANIIQTVYSGEAFVVCDDPSNDGIADFDLNEVEADLEDGYDEFETTFYETEEDRNNNTNPLDQSIPYTVTNNGTTIYATIISDECTEFVTVELEIAQAIVLETQFADYCDDVVNDGFTTLFMDTFNTVASQGVSPANVKYYLTEEDAINNENILPDYVYNSSNPQLFYIRVTNSQTGCYGISSLEVTVVDAPEIMYPAPIIVCDDDDDGIATVNLESQIPGIVASTAGFEISFYTNNSDAINATNPISDTSNFTTSTTYIYARVANESSGCYSVSGFYVYVNTLPEFVPISNYENCEADISSVADFYFYLKDAEILNGQNDKFVTYYETEEDAIAGTNPINKYAAYQNTTSPQTIYVRVENYTDPNCFGTSSFELEVGSLPIFNPAESIFVCDDISNDGLVTVDLNETIATMEAGSPEDLDITFYTSQYNADNSLNPVDLTYTNSTNPQQLFARVDNGNYCYGISAFEINIISAPIVNPSNPLIACDDNYDGILTWDLTIAELDILDVRQDDIEVSYFESMDDLDTDANPIINPQNYTNTTNPQTIFVKVNNTISDCYVSIPVDIIVNLPPSINDFMTVEICDNTMSNFDLQTVNALVTNDDTDIVFTYHNTQEDADTNSNPLDNNFIYSLPSHTIFARVAYVSTGCYATYPFELIINPLPIANQPLDLETCDDTSNDGFEIFNLSSQNDDVLQGQDPNIFAVSYHNSIADAQSGDNPLTEDYNSQNGETIFIRVTNSNTGCYSTTQFNTIVYEAPSAVYPIVICDNNYDGINTFNLTEVETDLYAVMPNNISITYFESEEDLNADLNVIQFPENYENLSNPQTVYIKVFNNSANCYTAIPLELNTILPPPINEFEIFEICDNLDSSFNLSEIESVLVDDATNTQLSYFVSYSDAETNTNSLSENYTYSSINDVIFVRVEDTNTGCFYIYNFILQINPLPIANQPDDMELCDDESNDGFAIFDLQSQTNTVLGLQITDEFTVTYHVNYTDASSGDNALEASYNGNNEQNIIVRIENNETGCYSLTDFTLYVNPYPNIPNPITECDIDYDGITTFDLTMAEDDLFATADPYDILSYYESMADLEAENNAILNPQDYVNLSNPQTVFIKVYNTVADCYRSVPLELNVNLPPAINDFEVYEICENETNSFDLSTINSEIVDTSFNILISYYTSENDALLEENALDNNYTYVTSNDVIYARVEFSTTHCYHIYPFELQVNPLPMVNQPDNLEACDDNYDGQLIFNLNTQTPSILGNLNSLDYSVTYYNDQTLAEEGTNPIDSESYLAFNNELITARVENNATNCYSLVSFNTIVNRKPEINIPDQVVCIDNLPLIVSAETGFTSDTYLWSTNATTPDIEITEIGTYSVTVTSELGCETISTFNVTESESATIELTETVDFSDPNNITITISGIGNYVYILDDGEPQESNIFENVSLGYHTITIIDLNGCAEVTKEVVVVDAPKFFTPNGDSQNDTWHIVGIETLPGSIVYIFDRYGKLLKQLGSNTRGWDGTYNGNKMPSSDYWFLAEIRGGEKSFDVRGHFSLRR
ncbi:choice-of-anchor L domain-containing protein [Winogradskyella aquimaris]|uniref:Choice-of-anchor L domain-containing protein n=1 Tax=Winogradskyella aquimaris TaxID=864074 RepID=A0ABU5EPY8_9FLAO|nr:choice-of-anchor L domain-containing protein [Winogradskyella aquimaris]MDY2588417.1 choice-of-anchor L domain-containing protein [Winogradskyella aquimaris]